MRNLLFGVPVLLLGLTAGVAVTADKKSPKAETTALVQGNNQFALDLYAKLQDEKGNLFFSPYSISSALAMTYGGARTQTAEEMAKTLHFDLDNAQLHPAFAHLSKEINGEGKTRGYKLSVANALWGQKGYPFRPEFLALNKEHYGAGLSDVDFAEATEAARKTINAWVEKETNNKIVELLKAGMLTTDTRLVLTNAIYFKGNWASQFKKDKTHEDSFHVTPAVKVKVPLMQQKEHFGYLVEKTFQMVEMPYVGKDLSMVVLLPKKLDGLAELEKCLTADNWKRWLGELHPTEVIVTLPKFKTTVEFRLKKTLSELGMARAFGAEADFSGMNGGKESLSIADVIHKAYVDVNEEGTEAAAATAVVVRGKSKPPPTPEFRADHPFVFVIRDRRSDSILFMGRLNQP